MKSHKHSLADQARDTGFEKRAVLFTRLSHDLRAPLNAILSFSQILIDGLSGQLNEEQLQQVDIIRKSGNNLLHVIDNVTMLSRTDLQNFTATPGTVAVANMLERLRLSLVHAGQGEQTELLIRFADDAPQIFTTDERKLCHALENMVRYAYQAGGAGTVTLDVSGVAPGALPVFLGDLSSGEVGDEGYLKLQIRHRCSAAEKVRLAELYLELDELDIKENEQFRGVHLGLSLARRSIEIIGGRIWIEQTAGGDLLTRAVIPSLVASNCDEASGWAGSTCQTGTYTHQRRTVLVVEDNPFNRNFIRLILDNMGFDMVEAEDGEVGVSKAREAKPDMILMDMMMPVMDGFQATRMLKSDPETAMIPVLAMTALSLEKDKRKAREAGCDDFLLMPSARDVLEDKLRFWAEQCARGADCRGESER